MLFHSPDRIRISPCFLSTSTGDSLAGIKQLESEADQPQPFGAEGTKNEWSHISTTPYVLIKWCLIKHCNNFAVTILGGLTALRSAY